MHALSTAPRAARMTWRLTLVFVIATLSAVVFASAADAHPLGNFTVNRYARVEVSAGAVRVYYVLDEAEIPAFQDRDAVRADPSAFSAKRAAELASGLRLSIDGTPMPLEVAHRDLTQP